MAAGIIPGPLIAGPEPIGRRYGILTAAAGPIELPRGGRGGGVRYVPVTCGTARLWPIVCVDGVPGATAKEFDPRPDVFDAEPFLVYGSVNCGRIGYAAEEFQAMAMRNLADGEQGAVELALWTGEDEAGNPLGITNLADTAVTVPVAADGDFTAVVAALEAYAYRTAGYGNVAYIHAPTEAASWAADHYLIVKDGPLLKTPLGSIWIFGGGYPGTGEAGAEPPGGGFYMHVTGQVTVWRAGEVAINPVDQSMDRSTNEVLVLAEREYAVGFDCLNGRSLFNPLGGS